MTKTNPKKLKPYGDRVNDGAVQLSFTLPVKASPDVKEAAKLYAEKMNLEKVSVVAMEPMGNDFTDFVVYGHAVHTVDLTKIKVPRVDFPEMGYEELKQLMDRRLERPIVVVGACTGTDAHTARSGRPDGDACRDAHGHPYSDGAGHACGRARRAVGLPHRSGHEAWPSGRDGRQPHRPLGRWPGGGGLHPF